MRGALLTLLLAAAGSSAMAEWVEVGESNMFTVYADPATIRRTAGKADMWGLLDFKAAQAVGSDQFMSSKSQHEYDCEAKQVRSLSSFQHAGNMGGGRIILSDSDAGPWHAVSPGSVDQALWSIACE